MLERKRKLDCANGREKADLVLKNGNVLNVFTEEVLKADVAICGDTIVGVGEYEGKEEIDCTGKYLCRALSMRICILNPVWQHRENLPKSLRRREQRRSLPIRTRS